DVPHRDHRVGAVLAHDHDRSVRGRHGGPSGRSRARDGAWARSKRRPRDRCASVEATRDVARRPGRRWAGVRARVEAGPRGLAERGDPDFWSAHVVPAVVVRWLDWGTHVTTTAR